MSQLLWSGTHKPGVFRSEVHRVPVRGILFLQLWSDLHFFMNKCAYAYTHKRSFPHAQSSIPEKRLTGEMVVRVV